MLVDTHPASPRLAPLDDATMESIFGSSPPHGGGGRGGRPRARPNNSGPKVPISPPPASLKSHDDVTYSSFVNGSILSVPKSWQPGEGGDNLVVSVYTFVKGFLG